MDVLMDDDNIDSVFINFVTAPFTDTDAVAKNIVEVNQMRKKPIVCNFMTNMSLQRFQETARILNEGGVPCYSFPTTAAKALGALYKYGKIRQRNIGLPTEYHNINTELVQQLLNGAAAQNLDYLPAETVYSIFEAYGIPVAAWKVVDNATQACQAATAMGYPVVVKAESADIVHKSDKGGVAINLKNNEEVTATVNRMTQAFGTTNLRFLVQQFLPGGKELIAGVSTKAGLGHMVMFGLGGIYVEVLKDVVFKIAPVTAIEAGEMMANIKAAKLLDGVRGEKGIDKEKVSDIIQRVSRLVSDFPVIAEMDMNPIMAFADKVFVVDGRIKIKH